MNYFIIALAVLSVLYIFCLIRRCAEDGLSVGSFVCAGTDLLTLCLYVFVVWFDHEA
jgi:hypothetical protein